jgi:hypothetical protein
MPEKVEKATFEPVRDRGNGKLNSSMTSISHSHNSARTKRKGKFRINRETLPLKITLFFYFGGKILRFEL